MFMNFYERFLAQVLDRPRIGHDGGPESTKRPLFVCMHKLMFQSARVRLFPFWEERQDCAGGRAETTSIAEAGVCEFNQISHSLYFLDVNKIHWLTCVGLCVSVG